MTDSFNLPDDSKPATPAPSPRRREREDRPKNNIKEDLGYRISGLEKAKSDPDMSHADLAALDRSIAKLKEKQAEKAPKPAQEEEKY
ncbi:MAG: hypothetical protein KW802_01325 [Candidatus Doudnabacteria bacterium]|nr:hypothetical protein [Candidatus Doudnabacteria bacterium]